MRKIESILNIQWGHENFDLRTHCSHLMVDLRVGIFSGNTEQYWSILFFTYHLAMYCIIFVNDVTELMLTVNDTRYKSV